MSSTLTGLIKKAATDAYNQGQPIGVLFGTVASINPLTIQTNINTHPLQQHELILTNAVRDYTTKFTFDNPNIKQVFTTWDMDEQNESTQSKISFKGQTEHEITIYNALEVGEGVILLRLTGGQKFLLLDRIEVRN